MKLIHIQKAQSAQLIMPARAGAKEKAPQQDGPNSRRPFTANWKSYLAITIILCVCAIFGAAHALSFIGVIEARNSFLDPSHSVPEVIAVAQKRFGIDEPFTLAQRPAPHLSSLVRSDYKIISAAPKP